MSDNGKMFTLLRGGEVFAPQEIGRKDILICDEKILAIGDGLATKAEALGKVEVIDATGRFVTPGFIDQHLHFLGGGDFEGPLGRVPELHVGGIVRGGVTTAVGIMGIDMEFKGLHGLLVKAHELQRLGLSTYIYTGSFRIPPPYLTTSVRADIVLIERVLGVKVALAEDTYPNLSLPDFAKVAGEVRLAAGMTGKTAVIHAHIGRNPRRLQPIFDLLQQVNIPLTQIVPTHVNQREPNTLEHAIQFARAGGTIDLSSNLSQRSGYASGINPDEAVKMTLAAGISLARVTLSSDANVSMPLRDPDGRQVGLHNAAPSILHREFCHIVRTNRLKLSEALPLVTSNVAGALGIQHRKGSLRRGCDADVTVLTPDLAVDTVISRGQVMVREGRVLVRGPFEGEATG
jgi:beta-aspartyl-dipeptidase (metallo-type)